MPLMNALDFESAQGALANLEMKTEAIRLWLRNRGPTQGMPHNQVILDLEYGMLCVARSLKEAKRLATEESAERRAK
jgi:hypothetical protein